MKPWMKFAVLVVAIIGTLTWLAAGGISETKTYYKTISEVVAMGDAAKDKGRIRVGGDVQTGSITREGAAVKFVMIQDNLKLNVVYTGSDPLPDTFRDASQALADGKMRSDGTFEANKIQAKCASKYEGKPNYKVPATQTTNRAGM